ncbi:hypothetical protein TFLX_06565 [Thermoflexales bacterium]|nr:hypothetical protein TFLX_06565 [Thermoflexales bacterium]
MKTLTSTKIVSIIGCVLAVALVLGLGLTHTPQYVQAQPAAKMAQAGSNAALGCRVTKGPSQSLPNGQATALAFDTQINDTASNDDCWTPTEPTRLYAREAGYYLAGGAVTLKSAQRSGRISLIVRRGGGNWIQAQSAHVHAVDDSIYSVATGMFYMNAGEYIEIVVYHMLGDGIQTYQSSGCEHCVNGWLVRKGN